MKKAIQFILYLVGILYLPTIVVISLTADQSGSFFEFSPLLLTILFGLMSLHFLCAFLEIGFTILRLLEKKKRIRGEIILNISTVCVAAIITVLALIAPDKISIFAIYLSLTLVALWTIGDIIFKQRKFYPEIFKKKSFWITTLSVFIAVSIFFAVTGGKFDKAQSDPLQPLEETQILY